MSRMEMTISEDERMRMSRVMLQNAWHIAFGSYIEQEAKKKDQWRDQSYWQLFQHLKHEVKELERSKRLTIQLHNLIDLCSLSTILLAKGLERDTHD